MTKLNSTFISLAAFLKSSRSKDIPLSTVVNFSGLRYNQAVVEHP